MYRRRLEPLKREKNVTKQDKFNQILHANLMPEVLQMQNIRAKSFKMKFWDVLLKWEREYFLLD